MTETTTETGKKTEVVDLVTRLGLMDLSEPWKTPYKPVNTEEETVIGVMSENLQRLDRVRCGLFDELNGLKGDVMKMAREHVIAHAKRAECDCKAFQTQLLQVTEKLQAVALEYKLTEEVFWSMLQLEFPKATTTEDAGIREGGVVVVYNENCGGSSGRESAELLELLDLLRLRR